MSWTRETRPGFALMRDPSPEDPRLFARQVADGLDASPRTLPCAWLYDAEGSRLFERITETSEYYQTRTEAGILARHADDVRDLAGAQALVEIGSGNSAKTRHLIRAWNARGPCLYVPIDISAAALASACTALALEFPAVSIEAIAASWDRAMSEVVRHSPLLLIFLGSSIGNLTPGEFDAFHHDLARSLAPGDSYLLGIDLIKDRARLEAAYDDAQGWTRRFIFNLFSRMNRELGCGIPLDALDYLSFFNDELAQIEIHVALHREVRIDLPVLSRHFVIPAGERIRVEICRKFRPQTVARDIERAGFALRRTFTDDDGWFAVQLYRRL